MTNTKRFASLFLLVKTNKIKSVPNATGDSAFLFKGLSIDNKTKAVWFRDVHTYWENQNSRIKCVRDSIINDFAIKGQPISDLGVGQNYTFTIVQTNALSFIWDLGPDGGIQRTASVVYSPKTMGGKMICANVTVFGGLQKSKCIQFYVQSSGGDSGSGGTVQASFEDEIYDGLSFGKLLKFGGLYWLQQDAIVQSSSQVLVTNCPNGFGVPSQNLLNAIVSSLADDAYYTLTRQAFYNISYNYLSSNQTSFFI